MIKANYSKNEKIAIKELTNKEYKGNGIKKVLTFDDHGEFNPFSNFSDTNVDKVNFQPIEKSEHLAAFISSNINLKTNKSTEKVPNYIEIMYKSIKVFAEKIINKKKR